MRCLLGARKAQFRAGFGQRRVFYSSLFRPAARFFDRFLRKNFDQENYRLTNGRTMDESSMGSIEDSPTNSANSANSMNLSTNNLSIDGNLLKSLYSRLKQVDDCGRLIETMNDSLDEIPILDIAVTHEDIAMAERFRTDVQTKITVKQLADEKQYPQKEVLEQILDFIFSSERGKSLNLNLGAICREYSLTLDEVARVREYLIDSSTSEKKTVTVRLLLRDLCFLASELEILLAIIYSDPNEVIVREQFEAATYIPIDTMTKEEETEIYEEYEEILDIVQTHRREEMAPKLAALDASLKRGIEETDMICEANDAKLERIKQDLAELRQDMKDGVNKCNQSIEELVIDDDSGPMDGGNDPMSNDEYFLANMDAPHSSTTTFAQFAAAHASDVVLPRLPTNPQLVLQSPPPLQMMPQPPPSPQSPPSFSTATMPKPPRIPPRSSYLILKPPTSEESTTDDMIVSYQQQQRRSTNRYGADSTTVIPLRMDKPTYIPAPALNELCLANRAGSFEWTQARMLGTTCNGWLSVSFCGETGGDEEEESLITNCQLAFASPPSWFLNAGDRVVAQFDTRRRMTDGRTSKPWMTAIVAEQPSISRNKGRYLVFNIDGDARYINYADIRCIWGKARGGQAAFYNEVLNPQVVEYLKQLLKRLPEKALVRVKPKEVVKFLYDGVTFRKCAVEEVDCCMVKLRLPDANTEWVYRGDWRLEPLYEQYFPQLRRSIAGGGASAYDTSSHHYMPAYKSINGGSQSSSLSNRAFTFANHQHHNGSGRRHHSRHAAPPVEFVGGSSDEDDEDEGDHDEGGHMSMAPPRAQTARKRTNAASSSASNSRAATSSRIRIRSNFHVNPDFPIVGKEILEIYRRTIERQWPMDMGASAAAAASSGEGAIGHRAPSTCDESCLGENRDAQYYKNENPMAIPIVCGWQRIVEQTRTSTRVVYVPPCEHRRLRHDVQLYEYLQTTSCRLTIDLFEFNHEFDPYESIRIIEPLVYMEDFTNGRENVRIECVNGYSLEKPIFPHYESARFTTDPKVKLVEAKDFISGCDCPDDCTDPKTCRCQHLTTIQASVNRLRPKLTGYKYRRLPDGQILTGIFECNSNCKCSARCPNRVVQHPMLARLQLFRTFNKGWGVRTVDAIPNGAFICIYAGNLMSDALANEIGKVQGDEFFADLDFIPSLEDQKEGYEEEFDSGDQTRPNESAKRRKIDDSSENMHSGGAGASTDVDEGSSDLIRISPTNRDNNRRPWIMSEYLGDECVFALDAKCSGNIGRYLNHSCDPNVFVQNVFIDTHDLRLPWVAFFANKDIAAGTELCWDYHYTPMDGRATACNCGAQNCRKRLL